jgi:ubiquinone/menaquinone biosynthesis C-methylase UbiE
MYIVSCGGCIVGVQQKLDDIDRVIGIANIPEAFDQDDIQQYYNVNFLPYNLFHSRQEYVHMGISRDGTYDKDDLLEPMRIVEEYLPGTGDAVALELAAGRGANAAFLADRHPDVMFHALDLTEKHVKKAQKRARQRDNLVVQQGDYHDLSRYADEQFDVVFIIESLCYAKDKRTVLEEVGRVLKPGGRLVVPDGYLAKPESELTEAERTAHRLTARGMAINRFEPYTAFRQTVEDSVFRIEMEEDVSPYVIPSMERFERLAAHFFNHPYLARIITAVLPEEFVHNAVSGYLMPDVMRNDITSYWITVLRKQ